MPADIPIPLREMTTFLMVLARILGVFVFLPLPGKDVGPSLPRVVLAFATAVAVTPYWPSQTMPEPTLGMLVLWLSSELALGLTIGILVGALAEAITVGAQVLSLQAGYAYASVVDPSTQADSDVLQVLGRLLGGLLFFCLGLDRLAIRTFVYSLRTFPPGQFALTPNLARAVMALSANIFVVALKLSLPVIAVLLTVEISMAVVGRLSSQLHLANSATSIKMLLTLLILLSVLRVIPSLYEGYASQISGFIRSEFWGAAAH